MKTTTQMTLVEIDKLIPYINNARTHSKEQINKLRSSLREFGFINPVIIGRDYGIIAGHGRVMAAREEGISEVPCVFVDHLTEAQKKAYIIADNRMALDAGWDEELLKVEIEALQAEAFDISLTGFGDDELSDLFGKDKDAIEKMSYAQYIAGMGFSNVGLGIVHSMAHPLGALYDTPHGVANAIILPTVMEYNAPYTGEKYREIARAMGVKGVDDMTQDEYRKAAVDAVKQLSIDVGIPQDLKGILKDEDVDFLSQSAMDDACRPGNPKDPTLEDIKALYRKLI